MPPWQRSAATARWPGCERAGSASTRAAWPRCADPPCAATARCQRIVARFIRYEPSLGGQVESHSHDKDTRMLHALGYAQDLSRRMSGFSNFAISFTIISILSGTLTLYGTGLNYGGPVIESYGWPIVSFFVIIVGLGMAEIASKYPTAGGLYYWASKMGGPAWG